MDNVDPTAQDFLPDHVRHILEFCDYVTLFRLKKISKSVKDACESIIETRTTNSDYPHNLNGHPPVDFPEVECGRCQRVRVVGSTGDGVVWTRAIGDNEDNDEDDDGTSGADEEEYDADEDFLIIKDGELEGYWLQATLNETLYGGRVCYAVTVRRREDQEQQDATTDALLAWEVMGERCAVKEFRWAAFGQEAHGPIQSPIQEVRVMQYIKRNYEQSHPNGMYHIPEAIQETHALMPRDVLDDGRFMYNVMPFCDGGDLFDRLVNEETGETSVLSEDDARQWILQILEGINTMQKFGVVHRDIGLENIMIHENNCVLIDLGMALRTPHTNVTVDQVNDIVRRDERGERLLIESQHRFGKIRYMPPEIFLSRGPFDGHAVDLWAVSVILFMMVTGFPPWDRPCGTDIRYVYICRRGRLEEFCASWNLGLSPQLIDLLQRMLRERPIDRLSLEQIRTHPWIRGEG